jgi:hypothetical protein
MRPVSPEFLRILRGSAAERVRATIVTGFPTGTSPAGTVIPVIDGDVQFDSSAKIRATSDVVTDGDLWPDTPDDPLNPYGPELFVERGVVITGGSVEWVSLGYYRIESVEQNEVPDGTVRVPGKDRMAGLIDARLEAPVQFLAATAVSTVFDTLVLDVYPSAVIEFDFDAGARTFPGSHIAEQDRHNFLDDMVKALGKRWFWDHRGVLVVKDPPDTTAPVWTINHGPDGVLVALSRERSREGVYNAVVATGEAPGTDAPVRAVARDLAPTSPTRWGGPFGKVPRFFSSPFITTVAQASTAAASILRGQLGLPYSVDFRTVTNPALEVEDPIEITYADNRPVQRHVVDKLTIPLDVTQAMTGTTRDQTTVDIGVES